MPTDDPRPEPEDSPEGGTSAREAPDGGKAAPRASDAAGSRRLRWDLIDAVAIVCYQIGAVGVGAWVGGLIDGETPGAAGKLVYVLVWCAMVLPVVPLVAKRWWGARPCELGIAAPREGSFRWFVKFSVAVGAGYLVLGLVCILVHHYVRRWLGISPAAAAYAIRRNGGVAAMLLASLVAAPLTEELTFRGVLYPALREKLGVGWAVLVSALVFAAVHPLQAGVFFVPVTQFLGGLIFAWSYEKTRSLVYPVIFHVIGNAGVAGLTLVADTRPGWLSWILG